MNMIAQIVATLAAMVCWFILILGVAVILGGLAVIALVEWTVDSASEAYK